MPDFLYIDIYVKDFAQKPIVGAIIDEYTQYNVFMMTHTADSQGKASFLVPMEAMYYTYKVSARGYLPNQIQVETQMVARVTATIFLDVDPNPPQNQFYLDLTTVLSDKRRVAEVQVQPFNSYTDNKGHLRVLIASGTYNVSFSGPGKVYDPPWWTDWAFPEFSVLIIVSGDTEITVWVDQGVATIGAPPADPQKGLDDLMAWLQQYWWTIPVGIGALLLFKPAIVIRVEK